METLTPDRLQQIRLEKILHELGLELAKQRPNLRVTDPKSVYGKAYKTLTKYDSTVSERRYLCALWKEHTKVIVLVYIICVLISFSY